MLGVGIGIVFSVGYSAPFKGSPRGGDGAVDAKVRNRRLFLEGGYQRLVV